ncbi:MAG: hypothetical protein NC828_05805, partial [Candidatus Omnitrophica bacterium]|nr:hypothetical protein [Candidatus Omnitrophota bacterium]
EEFVRFALNDKALTEDFKRARNRISKLYGEFLVDKRFLFSCREIAGDVGRKGFLFERQRSNPADIFWANLQRSKEALRVLEEFSKLVNKELSDYFRKIRFGLYELEKKAFKKLQAVLGSR